MIKKLSKHGTSLALVFDRSILESLGIDESTPLEISTDGSTLVVSPARSEAEYDILELALTPKQEHHAKAFRRLA